MAKKNSLEEVVVVGKRLQIAEGHAERMLLVLTPQFPLVKYMCMSLKLLESEFNNYCSNISMVL